MHAAIVMMAVLALGVPVAKPTPPGPGAGLGGLGYGVWAGKPGGAGAHGNGGTAAAGTGGSGCTIVPGPYPSMAVCGGNGALYGYTLPQAPGGSGPTVSPLQLALLAYRQLVIPQPVVQTAPPRGHDGLVGLPEFFWAERAQWHPLSKRAEAGAVWAEVTAVPDALTIRPGDGSSVYCAGPGTPYDPSRSPDAQDSRCTHLYERSSAGLPHSAYGTTASVVWTATWVGSGGAGGALPPITRTAAFPIRIAEGQALVQRRQ